MSAESLSANQVANLVKAMETAHCADHSKSDEITPQPKSETPARGSGPPTEPSVTLYDFKHPDRFGKEHLQTLRSVHESVAFGCATAFSELLRSSLDVNLASVTPSSYREFVSSREKPSCLCVVSPDPLRGGWLCDVTPALAFAIIDRMLGGDPVPGDIIRRPLTEIEIRLMSRIIGVFLEQVSAGWRNILALRPVCESIESSPHCRPVADLDESVVQIAFKIKWGMNAGLMTLCIPAKTIEPIRPQLSQHHLEERVGSEPTRRQIAESIEDASVSVAVTLARSRIKTSDLLGLSVGDVITTEQGINQPLELSIQAIPKFQVTAGAYQGKKAVQVHSGIETSRR